MATMEEAQPLPAATSSEAVTVSIPDGYAAVARAWSSMNLTENSSLAEKGLKLSWDAHMRKSRVAGCAKSIWLVVWLVAAYLFW